MRTSLRLIAVAAIASWLGVACDRPLSPVYRLDRARVLAIRSEPIDLAPDGSVKLDALLYLPTGSPIPTYDWSWCFGLGGADNGYQCTTDAGTLRALLDAGPEVSLDYALGSSAEVTFGYPAPPELLKLAACLLAPAGATDAGDGGDTSDGGDAGTRTFCPSQLTVAILLTVHVGDESLRATRQLTVLLSAPTAASLNPDVDGLTASIAKTWSDGGTPPDGGWLLVASVPDASSELYTLGNPRQQNGPPTADAGTDAGGQQPGLDGGGGGPGFDAGAPAVDAGATLDAGNGPFQAEQKESLELAWYVDDGTLEWATTTLPAAPATAERDWTSLLQNYWTAPASSTPRTFILVVRDNRGGVGWRMTNQ
jgi:hypothetical protein